MVSVVVRPTIRPDLSSDQSPARIALFTERGALGVKEAYLPRLRVREKDQTHDQSE